MTRYVILGAGAVGSSLAAQFSEAGLAHVLVARGRQLDHLRKHGLLYRRPQGEARVQLSVTDLPGLHLLPEDVLLLAVKGQDVEALSEAVAILPVAGGGLAADLPIFTLQNGLDSERVVSRRFARPYGAVVKVPAIFTETGRVSVLAEPFFASLTLGRFPEGVDDVTARFARDLRRANAIVEERADIRRWKSLKLLWNVRNVVELFAATPEEARQVGEALAAEAEAILRAAGLGPASESERGVDLSGWTITRDPVNPGGQSTWQSFARGARSEVDFLNGEIVLQARLIGRDAPWNRAAQRLAAELAASGGAPGSLPLQRLVDLVGPGKAVAAR